MMRSFFAVIVAVALGLSLGYSGDAQAILRLRVPSTPCTSSNLGQSATTVNVFYNGNGTYAYTDYATYICQTDGWVLADVTRCNGSRCVPL